MKKTLQELIKDKKILILGFGREGKSSFRHICDAKGYKELAIADANPVSQEDSLGHTVISGPTYLDCLDDYDIVFKSPGIVLPLDIRDYSCNITCQTDLFLKVYGKQTIGVTGTKGKSTTSSLLYHVFKTNGKDVLFGGNIGLPIFDITDQIKPETSIIFELSCHQLEYTHYACHMGLFLNLYEDHLDHYGTVEKYWHAKQNLYRNMTNTDILYCNYRFLPAKEDCRANLISVSLDDAPVKDLSDVEGCRLRGRHNLENVAIVYKICQDFKISREFFLEALRTFNPLPHRLEYLGRIRGIDYYDDSISTTVESAINAIEAVKNASTILLGGMDRGIDYDPLVEYLAKCHLSHIVLMYDSGLVIKDKLAKVTSETFMERVTYAATLEEACAFAQKNAPKGSAVLLSPAAASYGVFKNFEERGDKFKAYVTMEV